MLSIHIIRMTLKLSYDQTDLCQSFADSSCLFGTEIKRCVFLCLVEFPQVLTSLDVGNSVDSGNSFADASA